MGYECGASSLVVQINVVVHQRVRRVGPDWGRCVGGGSGGGGSGHGVDVFEKKGVT